MLKVIDPSLKYFIHQPKSPYRCSACLSSYQGGAQGLVTALPGDLYGVDQWKIHSPQDQNTNQGTMISIDADDLGNMYSLNS